MRDLWDNTWTLIDAAMLNIVTIGWIKYYHQFIGSALEHEAEINMMVKLGGFVLLSIVNILTAIHLVKKIRHGDRHKGHE